MKEKKKMEILWFVPKVFMMAKNNFNSPNKNTLFNTKQGE